MRVTSVMVGKNYQRNLNTAQQQLNKASETATNYRKFQSVSDDPAGATKAFQLRREYSRAEAYQRNAEDVDGRMKTAESGMINVQEALKDVHDKLLQGANGTLDPASREIIAQELRGIQKAITQDMNISYTGQYLFGGAATDQPPLTVGADGKLLYRGESMEPPAKTAPGTLPDGVSVGDMTKYNQAVIDYPGLKDQYDNVDLPKYNSDKPLYDAAKIQYDTVDKPAYDTAKTKYDADKTKYDADMIAWEAAGSDPATKPTEPIAPTAPTEPTEPTKPTDPTVPVAPGKMDAAAVKKYNDAVAVDDQALTDFDTRMKELSGETVLIDFGFGIDAENSQSGFDVSLSALNLLGFGKNDDGTSKNLYNLVGEMATYLETSVESFSAEEFGNYMTQFEKSHDGFLNGITNMGGKAKTIEYTLTRLKSSISAIEEKQNYVEFVDPAAAISDWKWQEFAYRSTLAIGTKILQPSLLDYLN